MEINEEKEKKLKKPAIFYMISYGVHLTMFEIKVAGAFC